jgi:hypothetical protein
MTEPAPVTDRPAQAPVYNEWKPIDTAPQDGRRVWVADSKGNMAEAVWRPTRQFQMVKNSYGKWLGKWEPTGYWSVLNFSGSKVPFKPSAWHE